MNTLQNACSKCKRSIKVTDLFIRRQAIRKLKTSASLWKVEGRRRVVVTGVGLVTCLGIGRHEVWRRLLDGDCGIVKLTGKEYEQLPSRIAGLVDDSSGDHRKKFDDVIPTSHQRNMSQGSVYALMATEQALCDAGWRPQTTQEKVRSGVAIGMGLTGMLEVWQTGRNLEDKGYRKVSPYFMTKILVNMAAGQVSLHYGLQGPNHSVSTACTTGLHAVGDATRFIQRGDADIMVAGGSEESPNPLSIAGFSR
ncbi:hypothetical protein FSP39_014707 [Pinctada imbricata]|uniref:beta-ketoacyl-[acyl-carrier-protein] synthase I n=1 Tax=Pinctada imbricata TaxID=66713 RepID=A0AA88XWP6_PINIB|nr:hypothetical protein FSP39_014707 [Pinctada imbricata]